MDRRNSDSDEPPRQHGNPNVFDDDFEVDPDEDDFMPSVSDGFRLNHNQADAMQRHTSTSKPDDSDLRRTATRNSTAKARDSVAHDGRPPAMPTRGPSSPSPLAHRASVSSTGSFATTANGDNPLETGPSHPYGMYTQHTMARTASVTTAPTEQPPRRSMSLQRPTHPYALYSQSGLDDALDEELPAEPTRPPLLPIRTAIPLGFPGLGAGYHRVLGPDGEEQDIIGPDGHTEQLPPYSRFPEQGPTKASLAAEASASSRVIPAPNVMDPDDPLVTPASPASPLSSPLLSTAALPSVPLLPAITPARLPPQRPETQTGSTAPVTSSQSSANQIPAEPTESSSASLLTTEQSFSEKAEPEEANVPWHKRKLWGNVPMGVALIVLILFIVFAIVLGAGIGALAVKKHHKNKDKSEHERPKEEPQLQGTGSHGSLFDATPIPTPSGLSMLPTGSFSLPLGIPQEQNPACLTQASQYSAWSCKLTFAPLVVTINNTLGNEGPMQLASMKSGIQVPDGAILYGLQTPELALQPMELVLDLDYKAYGPAYHFQARYDKLVILTPDELGATSGLSKREDGKDFRQRFQVKPGDLPWYCFWNNTYIEGYIYVEDNSTAASFTAFPTQAPSGSPSASYDMAGFLAAATSGALPSAGSVPSSLTVTAPTPSPVARRDAQFDAAAPPRMPPYPRIVKIEERRLPGSGQPYCQQMVLLENGKIAPAASGNEAPKKIWLQESDPSYEEYFAAQATVSANSRREVVAQKRSDPSDACHCQWMFK